MGKRMSDVERITTFFQTSDESAATVMFQVVTGIIATRFKKEPKKRGKKPGKASSSDNGNESESLRKSIRDSFYKEDIEKFSAGKKLEAMNPAELATLRDTLAALPAE